MTDEPTSTIEKLHILLRQVATYGAQAERLLEKTPEFVNLTHPAADHAGLSDMERASLSEAVVRRGLDAIGGTARQALTTSLGLRPGLLRTTHTHRRSIAAEYVGVKLDTYRRPAWEGALLLNLAFEIHYILTPSDSPESIDKPQ